jgi:ribonuclease Z
MGGNTDEKRIVDIYGPHGLRKYLLTSLEMSSSAPAFQFNIHELIPRENQFPPDSFKSKTNYEYSSDAAAYIGELSHRKVFPTNTEVESCMKPNTMNIEPCTNLEQSENNIETGDSNYEKICHWDLLNWNESSYDVKAAVLQHRIPCFGYVIHEKDKPGTLNVQKLKELGIKPGPVYAEIKAGIHVQMDNGEVINPDEFLGPPKKGRKVTILGDTKDSSEMLSICQDSDVVVHEATNENSLKIQAVEHGHSTPDMAAQFALEAKSRVLCLTHVSPRYRSRSSINIEENTKEESTQKSEENYLFADLLREEAQAYIDKNNGKIEVLVAEDFMVLPVVKY